ncbi:MAG: peptide chain release factor N(5)-glutamine methyltransferase [Bacteroidota bacterium]|jgi:release factor glutamine methyltransferase
MIYFWHVQIKEAYHELRTELLGIYDLRESAGIADLVMEEITGWNRSLRIIHHHEDLSDAQQQRFVQCKAELMDGRPVQYVLGHAWFSGMSFKVDERVLIPRPETEELVELVKNIFRKKSQDDLYPKRILDIGTGSGCIAIALKRYFQEWEVHAMDKSKQALELARFNASLLGTEIHFIEADIMEEALINNKPSYDIIVSNPPYIPEEDKSEMSPHVLEHEPHMALFTNNDDPIHFYKSIITFSLHHLYRGGMLFFETHASYAMQVAVCMENNEFEQVQILQDMQGKDRIVFGTRTGASL